MVIACFNKACFPCNYTTHSVLSSDVRTLEDSLALLLAPVVDTITTARNRLYLACNLVRDAVDLLVSILGLFLGGKELTSAGLWEGT